MKKKVTFQNEKKTPRRERKGVKEFFRTKKEKENTFAFEPFSSYAEPIFLGQQREKRETPLFTNEKRYREPALDFKGIPAGEGVHSIHPYPAMLHPRLVQYLIEQYSAEGDIVVDPFLGSGVTAVESAV
ncbi:MAG: DNA methyltransferase, partial [bacterium]